MSEKIAVDDDDGLFILGPKHVIHPHLVINLDEAGDDENSMDFANSVVIFNGREYTFRWLADRLSRVIEKETEDELKKK